MTPSPREIIVFQKRRFGHDGVFHRQIVLTCQQIKDCTTALGPILTPFSADCLRGLFPPPMSLLGSSAANAQTLNFMVASNPLVFHSFGWILLPTHLFLFHCKSLSVQVR